MVQSRVNISPEKRCLHPSGDIAEARSPPAFRPLRSDGMNGCFAVRVVSLSAAAAAEITQWQPISAEAPVLHRLMSTLAANLGLMAQPERLENIGLVTPPL